ncbi:MAG: TIGR04211 family SH3 domain-containing protein [Desulfarculus sp.]|nr:TIGR04211 family SH3 domain-containing protein [Desulfarculus sp.]
MKATRVLCLIWLGLLVLAGPAMAQQTMYVSDRMQITVRVDPGNDARVLAMVSSGEQVTVLEDNGEGWMRVQTPAGKEGWVLKRHLMEEKPAALRLKEMAPQDKSLGVRLEELRRELAEAKKALAQAEGRSQDSEISLTRLQRDCAEVIKLREDHAKLQEECQQKAVALEELTTENESLRFGTNIKWFLAGGGVLLLGWILGAAFSRRKRRWSNLD